MTGKNSGNVAENIAKPLTPVRLRQITERDAEMAALVMALEYYADHDQYRVVAEEQTQPMILVDRGKKARHALGQSGQRALQVHHFLIQTERRVAGQKHRLAELEAEAKARKDRLAALEHLAAVAKAWATAGPDDLGWAEHELLGAIAVVAPRQPGGG